MADTLRSSVKESQQKLVDYSSSGLEGCSSSSHVEGRRLDTNRTQFFAGDLDSERIAMSHRIFLLLALSLTVVPGCAPKETKLEIADWYTAKTISGTRGEAAAEAGRVFLVVSALVTGKIPWEGDNVRFRQRRLHNHDKLRSDNHCGWSRQEPGQYTIQSTAICVQGNRL